MPTWAALADRLIETWGVAFGRSVRGVRQADSRTVCRPSGLALERGSRPPRADRASLERSRWTRARPREDASAGVGQPERSAARLGAPVAPADLGDRRQLRARAPAHATGWSAAASGWWRCSRSWPSMSPTCSPLTAARGQGGAPNRMNGEGHQARSGRWPYVASEPVLHPYGQPIERHGAAGAGSPAGCPSSYRQASHRTTASPFGCRVTAARPGTARAASSGDSSAAAVERDGKPASGACFEASCFESLVSVSSNVDDSGQRATLRLRPGAIHRPRFYLRADMAANGSAQRISERCEWAASPSVGDLRPSG